MQNDSQHSDDNKNTSLNDHIDPMHQFDNVPKTREPIFNLPVILVIFVAICVGVHLVRENVLDLPSQQWVLVTFAYYPIRFSHEFFTVDLATIASPISYSFLHGDWTHLGFNMLWLVVFGVPVAYRLGWLRSVIFWCMTSLAAVLLHTIIYYGDPIPLVGASGAVSGFLGGAARFGFRANKANPRAGLAGPLYGPIESLKLRGVLPFLLIWTALNFAFGADFFVFTGGASIAWEAHIGGLIMGYFGIAVLDRKHKI